jgi:hypothetical protein
MPIDRLLKLRGIGPENSERLRLAFDLALRGLQLVDRNDPICEIVARKVIEIDKHGTHDARQIAAEAIKQLGP